MANSGPVSRDSADAQRIEVEVSGLDSGTDPFVAAVRATRMPMIIRGYAKMAVLSHGHLAPGMHVLIKPFHGGDRPADH